MFPEICQLYVHAATGCDTASAMFGVGKAKILKKLKKNTESIRLLDGVGMSQQISEDILANAAKFVRTVLYNGKFDETLVQTCRVQINLSCTVNQKRPNENQWRENKHPRKDY